MTVVTTAKILTADRIAGYLQERLTDLKGVIDSVDGLEVSAIAGGNVNYAFCLTLANGKTLFLKQAPEFVAIFGPDGFPLTSERMQREMDVYSEWKTLLGDALASQYLPEIFYFDKSHMVVVMQFLDGYTLLDHVLVSDGIVSQYHPNVATGLGDFMGRTHAATHSSRVDDTRRAFLADHFSNPEMRAIQDEFVFSKCYKEATDEQRAGLTLTDSFMAQVELLKQQYNAQSNTGGLVLCHGDLHPGSVMVDGSSGHVKVIDPEFTVYGPAGLDVGSLLSGYCLGAIHQAYNNASSSDNSLQQQQQRAVDLIVQGAQAIWTSYQAAFREVMGDNDTTTQLLKAIAVETVGFTVAEVCRTALEFAGGRKWLQLDNPVQKAAAKKAALGLVQNCMEARHEGGMELLWKEMKQAATIVSS